MNKVSLVGRLGQDPEERSGAVKFSVATNDGTKEKPKTNWHNIVAFGKMGENLQKYLNKGDQIAIVGRLDYNKHEDKIYTSVIVENFTFISAPKQTDQQQESKVEEQEDDLSF